MADWERPDRQIGERLRTLRRSAGLSQAELGAGRFSKEYVSQIELGKTRPSAATIEWLAERLDADSAFLEHGVSRVDAERLDAALGEAERLLEIGLYAEAVHDFAAARELASSNVDARARLRLELGDAWARLRSGDLDGAESRLEVAATTALGAAFSDLDRASVVFEIGVLRYMQSQIPEAITLLDQALVLAEGSVAPSDRLRSDVFHWRARCHRRTRDWPAADDDIVRALELAEACADERRTAEALFQASLVAQRQGRWAHARTNAERAREVFAALGDRATVARLSNNLAGLSHLLGDTQVAVELLDEAFETFVELDLPVDAGYVCSSLAEMRLEAGDPETSELQARKALDLLGARVDHLQEVGTAQLTLGRALAAQGRLDEADSWIASADATFELARSAGHRSSAWIAQGDVASIRGNDRGAAELYRRAASALREDDPQRW